MAVDQAVDRWSFQFWAESPVKEKFVVCVGGRVEVLKAKHFFIALDILYELRVEAIIPSASLKMDKYL